MTYTLTSLFIWSVALLKHTDCTIVTRDHTDEAALGTFFLAAMPDLFQVANFTSRAQKPRLS